MSALIKKVVYAAAFCCLVQIAGAEDLEKSLSVDPRGDIEVSNVAGSVRVSGWERSEIQVSANLGDDVERLDFKRDGTRTVVKVVLKSGRVHDGEAELTIHVPRESRLSINTVSADQAIDEVRGVQRLQSVSGDIRTQLWSGDSKIESVSGEISAKGAPSREGGKKGHVRVSSVSGSVAVDSVGDDIEVETVSGDMRVIAPSLFRARLSTTNGNLQLSAGLASGAEVDAEAINGALSFNFDGLVDADFGIETFSGRIDNCFGPKAKRKSEYGPGNELSFKEGKGSATVRIKTLNGKVTLCRSQKSARRSSEPRLYAFVDRVSTGV